MNKRKAAQAARSDRHRRRVAAMHAKAEPGPEVAALLGLCRPQLPIRQRMKIEAAIARVEKANAAAGLAPQTPPAEVPVVDISGPYVPGKSTMDRIAEAQEAVVEPEAPKLNQNREIARRLRQQDAKWRPNV